MKNNLLYEYQKNLGLEVRKKRLQMRLTQKELGKKLNITHEWVNKIENGKAKKISLDLVFSIIENLELQLNPSHFNTENNEHSEQCR
jgi:transcriptional regulator with XRE-family HTH domain